MSSDQPEGADPTPRAHRQRRMRRVQAGMAIFAACLGLGSFFRVAGKPRFETYHTLDVIQLMTAGAGLGVALVLLVQFFSLPHDRSETGNSKGTP